MINIQMTEQEAIYIREALINQKLNLRTIHSPLGDKELTEDQFLSSVSSENRRKNYMSLCAALATINEKIK